MSSDPRQAEDLVRAISEVHAGDVDEAFAIAHALLAAGYVHLVTHLNSLTAMERLELGDALCREAAEMDEDECIDDTDLCEHGLRFGCEDC